MTETPYSLYIKSTRWKTKRAEYLASGNSTDCHCCKKEYTKGFQFHHLNYDRLGQELLSDIVPVCTTCHEYIHIYQRSKRCSIQTATSWVRKAFENEPASKAYKRAHRTNEKKIETVKYPKKMETPEQRKGRLKRAKATRKHEKNRINKIVKANRAQARAERKRNLAETKAVEKRQKERLKKWL